MEDDRKSNASRHSTPQVSPQNSPAKTEAKVTQPVEQPPVAVATELKSGDATGAITNAVNTTGTTPTTTTTDSGNAKLLDIRPASKMDDSSTWTTRLFPHPRWMSRLLLLPCLPAWHQRNRFLLRIRPEVPQMHLPALLPPYLYSQWHLQWSLP